MSVPAPPPPPPPMISSHLNYSSPMVMDKTQLLLSDIRKGATLRRVDPITPNKSSNGLHNDEATPNTLVPKDLLQAELCHTLQRRKNSNKKVINQTNKPFDNDDDAPVINYQKPNYIIPKNSTIKAIQNELKAKALIDFTNAERLNSSNNTNTNLPSAETIVNELTKAMQSNPTNKEPAPKLMITHGKPNFTITSGTGTNIKKPAEKIIIKLNNVMINTENKIKPVGLSEQNNISVESTKASNDINNQLRNVQNIESNAAKSTEPFAIKNENSSVRNFITPAKLKPVTQSDVNRSLEFTEAININHSSNNVITNTIKRLKSVELLDQSSVPRETTNDIQKQIKNLRNIEPNTRVPPSSPERLPETNLNHNNSINITKHKSHTSSERSTPSSDIYKYSPLSPRRAQLFKQQKSLLSPEITSTPIHHLSNHGSHFESKSVVSFSKELTASPNRYPDTVRVKKSSDGSGQPMFMANVKFTIDSSGEVLMEKNY